jgi:8-oxo-dGTP diphosphatase
MLYTCPTGHVSEVWACHLWQTSAITVVCVPRVGRVEITHEVAIIVLTDRTGRVLMQHRGHDAHVEPGRWTPPGGRLEPGEDAVTAAHRELLEETGLTAVLVPGRVVEQVGADGAGVRFHVFTGSTDAGQEDVVLGEGLAMRFLTAEEIATKELVSNAQMFLSVV